MALSEKNRTIVYGTGLIGTGAVIVAQAAGLITENSGAGIIQMISVVGGLLGVNAAALAGKKLSEQRKDGTFNPVPVAPIQEAFDNVNALKQHVDDAVDAATAKVTEGVAVIQGAVATIPGAAPAVGALGSQVTDLIEAFRHSTPGFPAPPTSP